MFGALSSDVSTVTDPLEAETFEKEAPANALIIGELFIAAVGVQEGDSLGAL